MLLPRKKLVLPLATGLFVGLLVAALHLFLFSPLLQIENYTKDWRAILGRKTPLANDLVLLTIDQSSLRLDGLLDDEIESNPAFRDMNRGWPWPRSVYAALMDKLYEAGARVVAFDLLFPAPGENDPVFAEALQRHALSTVVGATFQGLDTPSPSFNRPTATLMEPGAQDDSLGFVHFFPEEDGVVRSALFKASVEDFIDRPSWQDLPRFRSFAASMLHKVAPDIHLPPGEKVPFRYGGPAGSYPHIPLYQVFLPELWRSNFQEGAFFKDKIVVIGPEGGWSHDEHPTPFRAALRSDGLMSGPELHMHAFAAARAGEYLRVPGPIGGVLSIALASLLAAILHYVMATPWRRFLIGAVVIAGYCFIALTLFNRGGLLVPVAAPVLAFCLTGLISFIFEFSRERFERMRSRATLERYVSSDVASEILDSPQSYLVSLIGVRKEVTVLFADLRNFTTMVSVRDAAELVAQLNEYYERVISDVFEFDGTLDKIMGDGMMAVWGSLRSVSPQENATNAVRTALKIQASLQELNALWKTQNRPQFEVGIGIAHGECVVGNVGSERKMDLTVIGEAANLASRLQGQTREQGVSILFDRAVHDLVHGALPCQFVAEVQIRGVNLPVSLYTTQATVSP